MRKSGSWPLGAARFRAHQALADLPIYDHRIEEHRRERKRAEAERAARRIAEEEAARAVESREVSIRWTELDAVARMNEEQLTAWRWEIRIVGWLKGDQD